MTTTIKFTAIDSANLSRREKDLIQALQEGYETGGGATHIARTELNELAVAFRPCSDTILILVLKQEASVVERKWADGEQFNDVEPSPSEYAIPAGDVQLECGIECRAVLC